MESKESNILKSILDSVSFGIELETCFHIIDNTFKSQIRSREQFYECMKNKSDNQVSWIKGNSKEQQEYKSWIVTEDESVACNTNYGTSCIIQGSRSPLEKCRKLTFHPVEIVSPILTGNKGLELFAYAFYAFLYTNNIIYSVNKSQGLHINMSHPNMDTEKFIKLWVAFEPVISNCVPESRRKNPYCKPLGKSEDPYKLSCNQKYVSVRTHGEGKLKRLEVRLQEGSMDFFEIYFWLLFCIYILILSMTLPSIPQNPDIYTILNILEDDGLQRMIIERYNTYKDKNLKSIVFKPSNKNLFIHPWNKWDDETQKIILEKRFTICETNVSILEKILTKEELENNYSQKDLFNIYGRVLNIQKLLGSKLEGNKYSKKDIETMDKELKKKKEKIINKIENYIQGYRYVKQTVPQLENDLDKINDDKVKFTEMKEFLSKIDEAAFPSSSIDKYIMKYEQIRKKYYELLEKVGKEFEGATMNQLKNYYSEMRDIYKKYQLQNKTYKELLLFLMERTNRELGFDWYKDRDSENELIDIDLILTHLIIIRELLYGYTNSPIIVLCNRDKKVCEKLMDILKNPNTKRVEVSLSKYIRELKKQ
jgi:hypothetical protein